MAHNSQRGRTIKAGVGHGDVGAILLYVCFDLSLSTLIRVRRLGVPRPAEDRPDRPDRPLG
jgi:hypothetical protein